MKKSIFIAMFLFFLGGIFSPDAYAVEIKQLTHIAEQPAPDTHTIGKSFHYMMDLVRKKSQGKIKIDIFDRAILSGGSNPTMVQNCQNGVTHVTTVSSIPLTRFVKELELVSLPFLFNNIEELQKFVNGPIGSELSHAIDKKGFKTLGFWPRTFRQLTNSKKEIKSPSDLNGLKIRVPEIKLLSAVFDKLGARVSPMAIGEVYTALQLKTVDGQENPMPSIYHWRFHEVQKYLTLWNYSSDVYPVLFNRKHWDSIPKDVQDIFMEAFDESKKYQFEIEKDEAETLIKKVKEEGMIVTQLTPEQISKFEKHCEPIYKEWENVLGKDIIKRSQEFIEKLRQR